MPTPDHSNTSGGGWGFAAGALLTGGVAVLHNVSKEEQHRREIAAWSELCATNYQEWENVSLQLKEKTAEAKRLQSEKARLEPENARLQALVDSQAKYIGSLENTYVEPKLKALLSPTDQNQSGSTKHPSN